MKHFKIFFVTIITFTIFTNNSNADEIFELYKYLHSNPELSWQEFKTSDILASKMEGLGFNVRF